MVKKRLRDWFSTPISTDDVIDDLFAPQDKYLVASVTIYHAHKH